MSIQQLYPGSEPEQPLQGLYLTLQLHRQAAVGEVLMYANYIASVDGRISLQHPDTGAFMVPDAIANPRDWRLYQELAAQSDVMLTSARYFRQLAEGCAQDLLPVGRSPAYADLARWRQQQGMAAQPDVVVISNSLDIPAVALEKVVDRRVMVCTSERADATKVELLQAMGVDVCVAGSAQVEGLRLRQLLVEWEYRSAYMIAGPEVHRTLVADGVLDRLFLTTHLSLLGGDGFHTVLTGMLPAAQRLRLLSLYLDRYEGGEQLLAQYALSTAEARLTPSRF